MPTITNGVKYLLWANIAIFALGYILAVTLRIDIDDYLALNYIQSPRFKPLQFVTYMFLHGSLMHIFFNMFALTQFGSIIEQVWGTKRFAFYYLVTGVGAAVVNMLVTYYQLNPFVECAHNYLADPNPDSLMAMVHSAPDLFNEANASEIASAWRQGLADEQVIIDNTFTMVQEKLDSNYVARPMVGASGAVFGLLLAFGVMFPNLKLQIIFIPIGIPAKYFVIIYGLVELFCGVKSFEGDNVAHFAHLGGMLFGILLLLWWRKNPHN